MSFLTGGYDRSVLEVMKTFEDGAAGADGMVFQGGIPFCSLCEHHMAPFFGFAHIGYIPNGKIVGLSKLSRVTDVYARRLQVQERLGTQVAGALMEHLEPLGCGVILQARHMCMEMRGVQKAGTITTTTVLRGTFLSHAEVRSEFMSMAQTAMSGFNHP
jgi:GTP cyclohydrolase I